MNWVVWTALGTGLLVAAVAGLAAFGSARWASATQAQVALLEAARVPAPAGLNMVYDASADPDRLAGVLARSAHWGSWRKSSAATAGCAVAGFEPFHDACSTFISHSSPMLSNAGTKATQKSTR